MDHLCNQLATIFAHDKYNINEIQYVLQAYKSNEADWAKFVMFDEHKYTRNLVDKGNGKYNLMILCWGPGMGSSIHDNAGSDCFVRVLRGSLLETRYEWPHSDLIDESREHYNQMIEIGRKVYEMDEMTYMNDSLGLHRMENPSHSEDAITLHLYVPAFDHCQTFDERTGKRNTSQVTFWSEFGEKIDICKRIEVPSRVHSQIDCRDMTRAINAVDWKKLLQFLAGDYGSFVSADSSRSHSATYRYGRTVVFETSELELTASLDRAAELVAVMPETARKMLLAPIKHGLLDLQSVFYLKDVTRDEKIAICVEDFLRLVSCYFVNSVDDNDFLTETLDIDLSDAELPTQLLYALSLILEGDCESDSDYAYADAVSYTNYSNSEVDYHVTKNSLPSLPSTRPPTISFVSKQSCQSAHSICNRKRAIFCSIISMIFLSAAIAAIVIYFINQHNGDSNPSTNAISVKFVSKSDPFSIVHESRLIVAFDYQSQMAIVTSNDAGSTTSVIRGYSWNGSSGNTINFTITESFSHCGVYAFYKTESIYCCCSPSREFCNFPDKDGTFQNHTISGLDHIYGKLHDFKNYNEDPTLAFITQYHPEDFNESYFLLFFFPNDKRTLNHSEVYEIGENIGHWRLIGAPQIRRTDNHTVDMLLEITDNVSNTVMYVMCNYGVGLTNGTMHRNGCIELKDLKVYMNRTYTYSACFHTIVHEGVELYMVALYTETPPSNSKLDKKPSISNFDQKSNVLGQLPLIAYNTYGRVVANNSYEFQPNEVIGQYRQFGCPLITDNQLFVYLQNSDSYSGYLLQYEFDLPQILQLESDA